MIQKNKFVQFMQFLQLDIPNVLAIFILALAFFVFFALSTNQESYAMMDLENSFVDSFNISDSSYKIISNSINYNGVDLEGISVEKYITDTDEQVFNLGSNNQEFVGTFNRSEVISDNGLLYVMGNNYPNKNIKDSNGEYLNSDLQTWITQVSIWLYLYYAELEDNGSVSFNSVNYISDEYLYVITHCNQLLDKDNNIIVSLEDSIYNIYIKDLVNNALKIRKNYNKSLQINTENNYVFMTNDQEYYQTSLITVTGSPSDNFNSFELKLTNVPDGTIIVDEEGKKIDDLNSLSVTSKFYIRVPKKNVNNANKELTITAIGSFETYEGYHYKIDADKNLLNVRLINNKIEKDLVIDLNY